MRGVVIMKLQRTFILTLVCLFTLGLGIVSATEPEKIYPSPVRDVMATTGEIIAVDGDKVTVKGDGNYPVATVIVTDKTFTYFGGFIPGIPIPTPFFLAVVCVIIAMLVLKFTNLGLYTQAVGINASSSRLNGLNPAFIKWLSFVILGLCVAVVALIKTSRLSTINYSVIAKDIEMDAILAVALGGNVLSGGKFNIMASILGAYVIQFLTTTLYKFNVSSDALPAYKAMVVIVLVVISAPAVKEKISSLGKSLRKQREVA